MTSFHFKGRAVRFQLLKEADEDNESDEPHSRVFISGDVSDDGEEDCSQTKPLVKSGPKTAAPEGHVIRLKHGRQTRKSSCKDMCRIAAVLLSVALLVSVFVAVVMHLANQRASSRPEAGPLNVTSYHYVPSHHHVPSLSSLYCKQSSRHSVSKSPYSGSCNRTSLRLKWEAHFANLTSSSAVRFIDINCDGILDVILGFGEINDIPLLKDFTLVRKCIYSDAKLRACTGGIIALDGKTGDELWRKQTTHETFAIHCALDVNNDGQLDCLVSGRGGVMFSIEPRTADILWLGDERVTNYSWNFMTPQIVRDFDSDGVQDIIVSHGGDTRYDSFVYPRGIGRLILLSGGTGKVISIMSMPDGRETYMSPVIHRDGNGTIRVLFGTGGESITGSLWSVELEDFARLGFRCHRKVGVLDCDVVANSTTKVIEGIRHRGASNPPVLVDLTRDGVLDVVVPMYDGRVFALDGMDFSEIWRVDFGEAESYMHPAIGRYNNDDIPDIMVLYQKGIYQEYNATLTAIINGQTGELLYYNEIPVGMVMAPSPLSLQTTNGRDWFLYWIPKETASIFHTSAARKRRHEHVDDVSDNKHEHDDHSEKKKWFNDIQFVAKSVDVGQKGWVLHEEKTGIQQSYYEAFSSLLTTNYDLISSPAITDIDGDGRLDLVHVYYRSACPLPKGIDPNHVVVDPKMERCHSSSLDIYVKEIDSNCPFAALEQQQWLAYLGTYGDGIYG